MTRIIDEKVKCAVCGKEVTQNVLLSTNSFGYSDTDFRPPQMMRSAMSSYVAMCPECGYANEDLSKRISSFTRVFVKQSEYKRLAEGVRERRYNKFYLCAYLKEKECHNNEAAKYYKMAAWFFDDACNSEMAYKAREKAIECTRKTECGARRFADKIILADMLRRNAHFEEALEVLKKIDTGNLKKEESIHLEYLKELCEANDSKCHTLEAAFKKRSEND